MRGCERLTGRRRGLPPGGCENGDRGLRVGGARPACLAGSRRAPAGVCRRRRRSTGRAPPVPQLARSCVSSTRRDATSIPRPDARVSLRPVKIRAAVLEDFGQPLVVQESTWQSPGTVRCSCASPRAACVTPISTRPPAPTRPDTHRACSGTRGPDVVERIGPGVTLVAPGDQVITLFAPECGQCVHCRSGRTNRCTAIREMQGQGYLPDGTTRLSRTASRCGTSWARRPSPSTR